MPWTTPSLKTLRLSAKNYIMASLEGADALIPNSVLRVMADVNAMLANLVLQFIAWLALQLLPITATTIWLDRWATMYLLNSDGTKGRKQATVASGSASVTVTSVTGAVVPAGSILAGAQGVNYITTIQSNSSTAGSMTIFLQALQAGAISNLDDGATVGFLNAPSGVMPGVTIITMTGGADTETDGQLQYRLLLRLANPPMGGDATDYEQWALAVPGVTRAWASPMEMGIGTMTVRFMCDSLRAANQGFPTIPDVTAVKNYINSVRPVTVKDLFVEIPIAYPINFTVSNLDNPQATTWSNIQISVNNMLLQKASPGHSLNGLSQPGQTIYVAWVSDAILNAGGVGFFDLFDVNGNELGDFVMPNLGSIAVLGDIVQGPTSG